jgi:hypothetical protein
MRFDPNRAGLRRGWPVDCSSLRLRGCLGDLGCRKRLAGHHQSLRIDEHDPASGKNWVLGRLREGGPSADADANAGQQSGAGHDFG